MDRNEAIALWDEHTVAGISKPFTRHVDVIVAAILAAYQRGIEDAIKAVPDSKWCSDSEDIKSFKDGIEWCRAEMLRRLEELGK